MSSVADRLRQLWQRFLDFLGRDSPPSQDTFRNPAGLKVGLTAFGAPSRFNLLKAIAEFKQYVESNSVLKLDIEFVQDVNLHVSEIKLYDPDKSCYMVTPDSLSQASKSKMPSGKKTDIVVYDIQGRTICATGLTWSNPVPFVSIPYSELSTWDFGWKTSLAPALVHEFNHSIYFILGVKGFKGLPDIDKASDLGYTLQNDPGWLRFRKYCYGLITKEMAEALMKD